MNLPPVTTAECGSCNLTDNWVLHNVRHRGIYRRLCTSCVLKLHPGLFCPICFQFYDPPPSPHLRALCQKCPSISHQHCLPSHSDSFVCPPCLNPTFSFFDLPREPQSSVRFIDHNASKVLVSALRIASLSMKKAALASRGEAERRLKEAAFAKKRARESLLDVESNAAKEKARSVIVDAKDKISQGNCIVSGVGVTLPERHRYPGDDRGNGAADHSCEVSANLEDKDRMIGFRALSIVNGVSTSTQDKERGTVSAGSGTGSGMVRTSLKNNISLNEKEKEKEKKEKEKEKERSATLADYNGLEEKANKTASFVLQGRNSSQ